MTAIPPLPRCRTRLTLAAVLALAVGSLLLLRVLPGHALDLVGFTGITGPLT